MHPIERHRKARHWSRAALAARLGVHRHTVRAWEAGALPGDAHLRRLAEVLGVDRIALLSEAVDWRMGRRGQGDARPAPPVPDAEVLAAEFLYVFDATDGVPVPTLLAAFADAYCRLDPDDRRRFRARVIGQMARHLEPQATNPLQYATKLADGWFPELP